MPTLTVCQCNEGFVTCLHLRSVTCEMPTLTVCDLWNAYTYGLWLVKCLHLWSVTWKMPTLTDYDLWNAYTYGLWLVKCLHSRSVSVMRDLWNAYTYGLWLEKCLHLRPVCVMRDLWNAYTYGLWLVKCLHLRFMTCEMPTLTVPAFPEVSEPPTATLPSLCRIRVMLRVSATSPLGCSRRPLKALQS